MSQRIVRLTQALIFATVLLFSVEFTKGEFECKSAGKFPHPDPKYYYECYYVGNNSFTMFKHSCPELSCFDANKSSCQFDSCENSMVSEGPVTPTFSCPGPGKFPHPDKSRKGTFYKCIDIEGSLYAYEYQCLSSKPCYFEHLNSCGVCNRQGILILDPLINIV